MPRVFLILSFASTWEYSAGDNTVCYDSTVVSWDTAVLTGFQTSTVRPVADRWPANRL